MCFLAFLSVLIFASDSICREFTRTPTVDGVKVDGEFVRKNNGGNADFGQGKNIPSSGSPGIGENSIRSLGSSEAALPLSKLSQGSLVLIDKNHKTVSVRKEDTVNLIDYTNSFYTINDYSMRLTEETAVSLGELMFGYSNSTGSNNLVVYDTANGIAANSASCPCPRYFSENNLGTCVDIAVKQGDDIAAFNTAGAERWIFDNCTNYGFILRYPDGKEDKTGEKYCPWHLRYVGKVHAKLMYDNNLCLEEYLVYLKNYSEENPLFCQADGSNYAVYSKECEGQETCVNVPINGNYDISGDNSEKFIITIKLN